MRWRVRYEVGKRVSVDVNLRHNHKYTMSTCIKPMLHYIALSWCIILVVLLYLRGRNDDRLFTLSTPTKPNASLHLNVQRIQRLVLSRKHRRSESLRHARLLLLTPELSPAFHHFLWKLRGIHTTTMMPVAIHMKVCGGPTLCRRQLRRLMLFKETA